jgi:hypothetical protein
MPMLFSPTIGAAIRKPLQSGDHTLMYIVGQSSFESTWAW